MVPERPSRLRLAASLQPEYVDYSSVKSCDIHLSADSQEMTQIFILDMSY